MSRKLGALKTAAARIGCTVAEYTAQRAAGLRWCSVHRQWEPAGDFSHRTRCRSAGRMIPARRPGHLTDLEVTAMRQLRWYGQIRYRSLCRMFGKSYHSVWAACNGHTFDHLPMPGPQ